MQTRRRAGSRLDITALTTLAWLAAPAGWAQLDTTVGDLVDREIGRQIEDALEDAVAGQIEAGVANAVEDQVAGAIADSVAQQVEAGVAESVQDAVQAGVVDGIEQQVESGVVEGIASAIQGAVTQAVEDGVGGALHGVADAADELGGVLDDARDAVTPPGGDDDADATQTRERFVGDVDAAGRSVERDVWVILVPAEHAARIAGWGFTIRERRNLAALARVLLRVDAPEDRDIAQAALDLALDAPGTFVDVNHVYRETTEVPTPLEHVTAVPAMRAPLSRASLAVGLVDSVVAHGHEALQAAAIVQRDFVPFEGNRPSAHGTAVASILLSASRTLGPAHGEIRLYAASVFFDDGAGGSAATTSSLVAALEWLAAEGARVINMSLTGPPNRVLEAALFEFTSSGRIAVAAVGNNGPAGEPLYPAAYESVVGVTAVDGANRIYRHANRGPHVTFAARGVRVKVAQAGGGYAQESGTSYAAPHAAAIIARALSSRAGRDATAVLAELTTAAIDLGAAHFDHTFGFGLIAPLE